MISYIKNNHCYLGSIIFRIAPSAYIREPDRNHDLMTLCPNTNPLHRNGNWYVEWGVEPIQECDNIQKSALDYCDCYGEAPALIRPQIREVKCNNMEGYQLFWGDQYQQDMRLVFPHEEGLYFLHVVVHIPGNDELKEIREVCQHEIVQTIIKTLHRDENMLDITYRSIENVGFSLRTYNALRRSSKNTIGDILSLDYYSLWRIPGLGKKSFTEILEKLAAYGFNIEHLMPPERRRINDATK